MLSEKSPKMMDAAAPSRTQGTENGRMIARDRSVALPPSGMRIRTMPDDDVGRSVSLACGCLPGRLQYLIPGLAELLKAFEYGESGVDDALLWDFAVEIRRLRRAGLTETDLRWLVTMEYVQHAREITRLEDNGRQYQPTGNLSFSKRTCFVLTRPGAQFARRMMNVPDLHTDNPDPTRIEPVQPHVEHQNGALLPRWDSARHELRVNGTMVKQFKWPALNQETILAAFEEEGWTPRIDDPLPPQLDQDPRRRLHDTIKCLNKNQRTHLIHFRGDGTGEGVVWEFVNGRGDTEH